MSSKLTSLENINFNSTSNSKQKINSPRSIEALGKLGYDIEDLLFIDFSTFKKKQINFNLQGDILQSRYDFFEAHRKEKIEELLKVTIIGLM